MAAVFIKCLGHSNTSNRYVLLQITYIFQQITFCSLKATLTCNLKNDKCSSVTCVCVFVCVTGTGVPQCFQLHLHSHLRGRDDDQGNYNSTHNSLDKKFSFKNHFLTHKEAVLFLCGDQRGFLSQFSAQVALLF